MHTEADCLFCRIASGELPADRVLETEDVVAFRDINPQAPTHVLVIPREHVSSLDAAEPRHAETIGRLHLAAARIEYRGPSSFARAAPSRSFSTASSKTSRS